MVNILLAEGFEDIEALATADILRRANLDVCLTSVAGVRTIKSSHGISIKADNVFKKNMLDNSDCVILPGGMPGALNLSKHDILIKTLLNLNARKVYIAAICASPAKHY